MVFQGYIKGNACEGSKQNKRNRFQPLSCMQQQLMITLENVRTAIDLEKAQNYNFSFLFCTYKKNILSLQLITNLIQR